MAFILILIGSFFEHPFVLKLLDWPALSFIALITILLRHRQSIDVLLSKVKISFGDAVDGAMQLIAEILKERVHSTRILDGSESITAGRFPTDANDRPMVHHDAVHQHEGEATKLMTIEVQEAYDPSAGETTADTEPSSIEKLNAMNKEFRVRGIIKQLNHEERDLLQQMCLGYEEPLRIALEDNIKRRKGLATGINRKKMREFEIIEIYDRGHRITSLGRDVAMALMS